MRILVLLRSLWRTVARRDRLETALDDELRAYVDFLTAEYERAGMLPALARRAALIETGGIEQVKEATRGAWIGHELTAITRELRYALRSLRRSWGFLAVAVITLALGIGGATAVFTVINASLLRPLAAVREPHRLVTVERVQTGPTPLQVAELSYLDYRDLAEQTMTLTGLAAFNGTSMALKDAAGSSRAWVSVVSDNFFTVLGVRPATGRLFAAVDTSAAEMDGDQIVVLGYALWQHRFGGSASVIGSALELDGRAFTIIGVAPPGFIGAMAQNRMELWIPLAMGGRVSPVVEGLDPSSRQSDWLRLVGRLAPGKTVEAAQRDLAGIAARLEAAYPTNRGRTVAVLRGAGMTAEERAEVSRVPRLLAATVALLLLIACGNVATLSLVRAAARRRELATRVALGASRATLVRQVVLEGALIAAGAGVLGVIISQLLVRSSTLVRTAVSMPDLDLHLDLRVLGVALAASGLATILVSLLPAVQVLRIAPGALLKDGGGPVRRSPGQRALVAAQVGASLVMLSAASVIFGAFQRILDTHGDVDPRGLTYAMLDVESSISDQEGRRAFYEAVLARVGSGPGIAGAAVTSSVPPLPWSMRASVFRQGEEPPPETLIGRELELGLRVNAVMVSGDFFDVMRVPLVRGRAFLTSDDERSPPVAIVSRRLADALWPAQDPVGRLLVWPSGNATARPPLRVVGVAADTRDLSLTGSPLAMYVPFRQRPHSSLVLAVRAHGDSPVPPSTLRRIVADIDPRVAMLGGQTLHEQLRNETRPQRTASAWIGVFGALALLLASLGLYGVVAQGVLQRRRELAVRAAVGASPGRILATVLGDGMRLVAVGAVAGGLGSIAAFRILRSIFSGVQTVDMRSAVAAAAVLVITMLATAYLPARRAATLDPSDALRCD